VRIETAVEIEASPERVWSVLTDLRSYPEWNPFVRSVSGELRRGEKLVVRLEQPNTKPMTFRPTLLEVRPNKELRWLGRVLFPGIFDGEHYFLLEATEPGGTRFVQGETFRGVMVPLLRRTLERDARRGFEMMNDALKRRAEQPSQFRQEGPS